MLRMMVLLFMLAAGAAGAGPWPLPEGTGHLCFAVEGRTSDASEAYATLYTEYGLGKGRTLGLDLGQSEDELDKAVLFMRRPFGPKGQDTLYAYELGIGAVRGEAALRPGLSIGKGLEFGAMPGWIALDMRGVIFEGAGDGILESDLTLGAEMPKGDKWMVQLQMAAPSDRSPYVKIAPSYAFRAGEGRHLLLGAAAGVVGTDTIKVTLGLWQRF